MSDIDLRRSWTDILGESEHEIGQIALMPQSQDLPIVAHRDGRTGDVCVKIGEYTYPIELEPTTLDHTSWTCYNQEAAYHTDNRLLEGELYTNEYTHDARARFYCKFSNTPYNREHAKNQTPEDDDLHTNSRRNGRKKSQSMSLSQTQCAYNQYNFNCDMNDVDVGYTEHFVSETTLQDSGKEWYDNLAQYNEDFHFAPKFIPGQNYRQIQDITRDIDRDDNFSWRFPPVSEVLVEHDNFLKTQASNLVYNTDFEVDRSAIFSNCSKCFYQTKCESCMIESSNYSQWVSDHKIPYNKSHAISNKMKPGETTCTGKSSLHHTKVEIKTNHAIEHRPIQQTGTPQEYHLNLDIKRQLKKMKRGCRLWEFIRNLLLDPTTNPSLIRWENREEGTFKLVQSKAIAHKWGMKKGNEGMTYEKLSRAMRYYYKRQVFQPVLGKRLVYRFGPRATGWKDV